MSVEQETKFISKLLDRGVSRDRASEAWSIHQGDIDKYKIKVEEWAKSPSKCKLQAEIEVYGLEDESECDYCTRINKKVDPK